MGFTLLFSLAWSSLLGLERWINSIMGLKEVTLFGYDVPWGNPLFSSHLDGRILPTLSETQ
jgi:hypothetical protein